MEKVGNSETTKERIRGKRPEGRLGRIREAREKRGESNIQEEEEMGKISRGVDGKRYVMDEEVEKNNKSKKRDREDRTRTHSKLKKTV